MFLVLGGVLEYKWKQNPLPTQKNISTNVVVKENRLIIE